MSKSRLEAFTDGVIAIIITILILGIDIPDEASFAALWELRGPFLVYIVSFVTLAIYWVNHHHLFQIAHHISGAVMLLADLIWLLLARILVHENGKDSAVSEALRGSRKSYLSIGLIALGLIAGVFFPIATLIACVLSLTPWLIPDRRIERMLQRPKGGTE